MNDAQRQTGGQAKRQRDRHGRQAGEERIAEAVLEGQLQVDVGHVGYGAHRAHGQVNGAEQKHHCHACGHNHQRRRVAQQVFEVAGAQEVVLGQGEGYQQNNDGRKAEVFCDVVPQPCTPAGHIGSFCLHSSIPPYIIRLTTSTWEGLWSAGASNSPVTRPSFMTSRREHKPIHSSVVSPSTITALPSSVMSRIRA